MEQSAYTVFPYIMAKTTVTSLPNGALAPLLSNQKRAFWCRHSQGLATVLLAIDISSLQGEVIDLDTVMFWGNV